VFILPTPIVKAERGQDGNRSREKRQKLIDGKKGPKGGQEGGKGRGRRLNMAGDAKSAASVGGARVMGHNDLLPF